MYEFQGVFARQPCPPLRLDPRRHTLRDLRPEYPFCGIRFHPRPDEAGDDTVDLEEATLDLIDRGLTSGLALSYATFGGPIEYLAGFEVERSRIVPTSRFEATFESLEDDLCPLFVAKMTAYGIPLDDNGFFFPFERDFWGE